MSEFSRPVRLDTLGSAPRELSLAARAEECAALAKRFGLAAIDGLSAEVRCSRNGDIVEMSGRLRAAVTQICVATGEPVPAQVDEPFALRFVPEALLDGGAEEIELSEGDCDLVGYDGGAIDAGEAVAETLALVLNPFPRSPDADAVLRAAGVMTEEDAGPFAALKALKDKLQKR